MHRIHRQRWQVQTLDRDTAFAVRAGIRQQLDALGNAFARGFDVIDQESSVIHIPRLTLHLRVTTTDELVEKLPLVLAEQLASALLASSHTGQPVHHFSRAEFRRDTLLHYLHTGNLAWSELSQDALAIRSALAETARQLFLEQAWGALRGSLPSSLVPATLFFRRLLSLLATPDLPQLIKHAHQAWPDSETDTSARTAQIELLAMLDQAPLIPALNTLQHQLVAALQLACAILPSAPELRAIIALFQAELPPLQLTAWLKQLQIRQASLGLSVMQTKLLESMLTMASAHEERAIFTAASAERSEQKQPLPTEVQPLMPLRPPEQKTTQEETASTGLNVHVAGLVLLHPYLPRLFEACGIALDEMRIAASHLPRAAALLHWLACGRDEVHEFELGTIKPLLGLVPETPLPLTAGLIDDKDKEECVALLDAAISYWQAIGSTSRDGLRISFLQRPGLLVDAGGHWQLLLESEAFDVLLAQLPWSISLIKLPWMTKPIFTDWPTR